MEKSVVVSTVKCKKCGDQIYSRARHDFRWCACKSVAVDGGRDYLKISGESGDFEVSEVTIAGADQRDLFEDWNSGRNKYGEI